MKEQKSFIIRDGFATLVRVDALGNMLECQLPESFLPEMNQFLNSIGLPKFEDWFRRRQDFGWIFRLVMIMQITASTFDEADGLTYPEPVQDFLEKWAMPVSTDIRNMGGRDDVTFALTDRLMEINATEDMALFSREDVLQGMEILNRLMVLSHHM